MRIAYLISVYPSTSHTFIRREIASLRSLGVTIETFSIRAAKNDHTTSATYNRAVQETFNILPVRLMALLLAHASAIRTKPWLYLKTLIFAMRHRVPGLRALIYAGFYFTEAIILAAELRRRRVSHIHSHFANAGATVGLLSARFLQLPWSLTLHGISETDYPAGLLLGAKIQAAEFVACASYFGRAQAMRVVAPCLWSKLIIGRCGLDLTDLPTRAARGGSRSRIVCVGRFSAEKGHLGLLEAFSNVVARGVYAELLLVGDGPERPRIERAITVLRLNDHVILRGSLSETETLAEIANSDVLVLASFMEGLPVVLMEAMALSVPVIASRVAGIPELVQDGVDGLLFSPSHWVELETQLVRLLTDPALRTRLAAAGREKVATQHDIRKTVKPIANRFISIRKL